ncbi:putative copper homeostasis (lipo)protein LpqS [Nocardia sp. NPDC001965]
MADTAHASATSVASSPRGRRSRTGTVLIVLAALALLAPLLHCDLVPAGTAHSRAHAAVTTAAEHHDRTGDSAGSQCTAHAVHCVAQVVLPARIPDPFTVAVPVALALTTAALSLTPVTGRWIRGPPAAAPAGGGREILTRFCIARR